jgi:hypothetical protein
MKSEDILKTLGYLTLVVIAIYVLFGMLEIGGKGLASIGEKKIMEGLEDRELDRISKKLQKKIDSFDNLSERFGDEDDDLDQVEDLPEYKDMIELYKEMLMRDIRKGLKKAIVDEGKEDKKGMIESFQMLNVLNTIDGGSGSAASKVTGGMF